MDDYHDQHFIRALRVIPSERSQEDLDMIYGCLRGMEALCWLREPALRALCRTVRYQVHYANDILYCRGELATCWYILLSGSVFIDGSMYLPRSSFGKRSGGGGRRANECLILEPSEMIVIDYPDVQLLRPGQRSSFNAMNLEKLMALEQEEITIRPGGGGGRGAPPPPPPGHPHHPHPHHPQPSYDSDPHHPHLHHPHAHPHAQPPPHHPHQQPHHDAYLPDLVGSAIMRGARSRGSVGSSVRDGSDTSSAYSGSDTMCHSLQSSIEPDDVDLSGLTESAVDSDEEDLAESIESLAVRDAVRECLEKDPSERSEDDIKVLLEFTQRLRAFSNMTLAVRKAMCQAMVFAVVDEAGTVLMKHGEELDSWSVIINGHVEVTLPDSSGYELHLGDSFGITPTMEKLYHQGEMRSKVEDCQFVCIRQTDYYRILHQSEENIRRVEENGVLVMVTEQRPIDAGNRKGNIVIKGTSDRLMQQLVEVENNIDPTYVEDFLLTHRTFIESPLVVANKLLQWFEDPSLRDRVTRVVLLWVNNHFTDFEMDPNMMNFLEQFEEGLEREKMAGQLRLLDFACATKARARTVTLTRPSRDEVLHFSILGGYERGFSIFISQVEKGSKAEDTGLKRGDQILEVNGQSFDHMTHAKALEILRQTCHLSITVKSNLLAFKEMLMTPENSPRPRSRKPSDVRALTDPNTNIPLTSTFSSTMNLPADHTQQSPRDKGKLGANNNNNNKAGSLTNKANKIKRKVIESLKSKNNAFDSQVNSDDSVSSQSSVGGGLYHSHSNPDLSTTLAYEDATRTEFPEHVLKVYRATDQAARFLPVHKETTAREVVMLALQIFNISDPTGSSNYALYEVTVTEEGITKQKRLPDSLQNLAERIGLSSRYYLKNITVGGTLFPDDIVNDLIRESTVHFLQLNAVELAVQLTLEDYTVFRQIEPTEYIDYLFHLKSNYGTPALTKFAELVNREMFWVVTEVCSEHNLIKRAKTVKQFIKVARQCKECKNFNSMFAILSGLGHGSVSRLKQTWERLSSKYQRMYQEMQELMDPSRNMSKYRNLVQNENIQSPIIPFHPVVARDLTFTHEGNDDKVEGLINFEKLRMISRYIRDLQNMCSAPYDLFNIQDSGGQAPSSALISLNQMASGGNQIATVKRRKKSTAAPDKKKMYEEAQMVRRVKAYLSRMNIISDEDQLRTMSYECEAGAEGSGHKPVTAVTSSAGNSTSNGNSGNNSGSAPPSNPQPRRRTHSPTPSTTSSTSSTSQTSDGKKQTTKFGATSPQSISKMKALAEPKTKPHHGPRSTTTTTTTTTTTHHSSLSPTPSPGPPRRGSTTTSNSNSRSNHHERSHSDTHAVPVDLSAESSSVTSLSKLHKSHTSGMPLDPATTASPRPLGHASRQPRLDPATPHPLHLNPAVVDPAPFPHVDSSPHLHDPPPISSSTPCHRRRGLCVAKPASAQSSARIASFSSSSSSASSSSCSSSLSFVHAASCSALITSMRNLSISSSSLHSKIVHTAAPNSPIVTSKQPRILPSHRENFTRIPTEQVPSAVDHSTPMIASRQPRIMSSGRENKNIKSLAGTRLSNSFDSSYGSMGSDLEHVKSTGPLVGGGGESLKSPRSQVQSRRMRMVNKGGTFSRSLPSPVECPDQGRSESGPAANSILTVTSTVGDEGEFKSSPPVLDAPPDFVDVKFGKFSSGIGSPFQGTKSVNKDNTNMTPQSAVGSTSVCSQTCTVNCKATPSSSEMPCPPQETQPCEDLPKSRESYAGSSSSSQTHAVSDMQLPGSVKPSHIPRRSESFGDLRKGAGVLSSLTDPLPGVSQEAAAAAGSGYTTPKYGNMIQDYLEQKQKFHNPKSSRGIFERIFRSRSEAVLSDEGQRSSNSWLSSTSTPLEAILSPVLTRSLFRRSRSESVLNKTVDNPKLKKYCLQDSECIDATTTAPPGSTPQTAVEPSYTHFASSPGPQTMTSNIPKTTTTTKPFYAFFGGANATSLGVALKKKMKRRKCHSVSNDDDDEESQPSRFFLEKKCKGQEAEIRERQHWTVARRRSPAADKETYFPSAPKTVKPPRKNEPQRVYRVNEPRSPPRAISILGKANKIQDKFHKDTFRDAFSGNNTQDLTDGKNIPLVRHWIEDSKRTSENILPIFSDHFPPNKLPWFAKFQISKGDGVKEETRTRLDESFCSSVFSTSSEGSSSCQDSVSGLSGALCLKTCNPVSVGLIAASQSVDPNSDKLLALSRSAEPSSQSVRQHDNDSLTETVNLLVKYRSRPEVQKRVAEKLNSIIHELEKEMKLSPPASPLHSYNSSEVAMLQGGRCGGTCKASCNSSQSTATDPCNTTTPMCKSFNCPCRSATNSCRSATDSCRCANNQCSSKHSTGCASGSRLPQPSVPVHRPFIPVSRPGRLYLERHRLCRRNSAPMLSPIEEVRGITDQLEASEHDTDKLAGIQRCESAPTSSSSLAKNDDRKPTLMKSRSFEEATDFERDFDACRKSLGNILTLTSAVQGEFDPCNLSLGNNIEKESFTYEKFDSCRQSLRNSSNLSPSSEANELGLASLEYNNGINAYSSSSSVHGSQHSGQSSSVPPLLGHNSSSSSEPQPRSLVHPAPTTFCDEYGNEHEIAYV